MNKQLKLFAGLVDRKKPSAKPRAVAGPSIFVDGASRGNPGRSGIGIYIKDGDKEIKRGFFVGKGTNNKAEYLAVVAGVVIARQLCENLESLNIFSDSQLMVRQMTGEYKVRTPHIVILKAAVDHVCEGLKVKFRHVMREKNVVADQLANDGIDKQKLVPSYVENVFEKCGIELTP
ncbi:ribonuclease HI family protein [bacterium]|jgi:ribonuclease HI|nr:ribonuclease HI family protein [bacterium]